MSKKNIFIFFIIAPLLSLSLVGIRIYYAMDIKKYQGPEVVFTIKPGEAFSSINYRLKKEELISSSKLFYRYAKLNDLMTKFKVGNYVIKPGLNMFGIFDTLLHGKAITIRVTIPEGKNLFQIAQILENKKITNAKKFIKLAKNEEFVHSLGIPAKRVEGYLYPDTYQFSKNSSPKLIIKSMVNLFSRRTKNLNWQLKNLTKHQLVTLASVVEKETGAGFERPIIAGVFHNRLLKRMRLQSDPTTIYGIFESYKGNIRKRHLQQKTPYNTYKIPALPVGPISNPGLTSLNAVLNPQKHQFLYFVSKNDGTHQFSKSYKDHRKAVNYFQKNRKNRKGKSWRDLKK